MDLKFIGLVAVIVLLFSVMSGCIKEGKEVVNENEDTKNLDKTTSELAVKTSSTGNITKLAMPPGQTPGWYAGDSHVHSNYSDNTVCGFGDCPLLDLHCIPSIHDMIASARQNNLSWIIFTEHGYGHTEQEWWQGFNECNAEDTTNFRCMYGQELITVVDSWTGCLSMSEFLAYDSTDYIPNECMCNECDNPQTVINRVINSTNNGFGFIAHPYNDGKSWHNWSVTGFTGLEIWNNRWNNPDATTINNHGEITDSWVDFLLNEQTPEDGFVVGIGNSDAHTQADVGRTFTYCRMDSLTESNILEALKKGRCVASDGPLVTFTINEKEIGGKIDIISGESANLSVEWTSTFEFGNITNITIKRGNISASEEENITNRTPNNYSGIETITINQTRNCYYRLEGFTDKGKRVYTNPIWVNVVNCNCSNCSECEEKLNNPVCSVVKLNKSITGYSGTCINNSANFTNKTFDCQGHTIDGDDLGTGQNQTYGIYLNNKQNNTIKNCIITDFYDGIFLYSSPNKSRGNQRVIIFKFNLRISMGIYYLFSNNYKIL